MSNCEIDEFGNKCWYNDDSVLHRLDGPAVEWRNGNETWLVNGGIHRIDGPAIEWADGTLEWWINDCEITNDVNEWVKENNFTIPFDEPTQMMFLMKFG